MISSSGLWLPKAPSTIPGLAQGLRRYVLNKCEMNSGKSYFNYYGVPRNMWINIPSTQRTVWKRMMKTDTFCSPCALMGRRKHTRSAAISEKSGQWEVSSVVTETQPAKSGRPGLESWVYHLRAVCPCASYLISLGFSFYFWAWSL